MTAITAPALASTPGVRRQSRRELRFDALDEILVDAESFADGPATALGEWTPAQNIDHVRRMIRIAHARTDVKIPWVFRVLGRVLKSRFLRSAFKPGLKTAEDFQPPADITLEHALASFRDEIKVASRPGAMSQPSRFLGKLAHDEWVQLHCRHSEHHFGYVLPAASP